MKTPPPGARTINRSELVKAFLAKANEPVILPHEFLLTDYMAETGFDKSKARRKLNKGIEAGILTSRKVDGQHYLAYALKSPPDEDHG